MKLRFFDKLESQATRMTRMMHRRDVDVVELATENRGIDMMHARVTCLGCRNTNDCDAWLAGQADARRPHEFCPNAGLFEMHARKG